MNQTITIDGREVIISLNTATGETTATFPDIHLDNLNPTFPLVIQITPATTVTGALSVIAQVLALIPPTPTAG